MSGLEVITLQDSLRWDYIVRSFKEYDIYWLSGYVKAFKIHGDGEPLLFYFDNSSVRGINVVMKRDISKCIQFKGILEEGCYFDYSTPYGYGGWLIEGEHPNELFQEYSSYLKEMRIVSEFVRFHPMVENHNICKEYYDVIKLGEVVHIDLSSPETIWENITSKNRNVIRKAMKNNIKIYNGRYPGIFEKFIEIYNSTMSKDQAEEYYYFEPEFYTSVLEDLPQNAQVFWAEKDNLVIAASIMLAANGRMNYHLSGSVREYSSFAPTNLLLYEAALWGASNGFRTLYLGGGVGAGEDGLFRFKRAFNKGQLKYFYIGKKIHDNELYNQLVKMRKETKGNYFPEYRA